MKKENVKSINSENIWYIKSPANVLQRICENPRSVTPHMIRTFLRNDEVRTCNYYAYSVPYKSTDNTYCCLDQIWQIGLF